ncbi:MAG: sialidase family protein, partial [Wenzhouxiangellaceae bacterium]
MRPTRFPTSTGLAALALLTSTMAYAELRIVDNPAGAGALAPSLAEMPDDAGVVMSWLEKHGDGHTLKFSVFTEGVFSDPSEIARGRNWFANWADTPGIHVRSDGTWLAHWLAKSADSTYAYDVRLAHSTDIGASWSTPQTPHTDDTPTEHGFVSYFAAGDGRTGMLWLDGRQTVTAQGDGHDHAGSMTLRTATIAADGSVGPDRALDERVCDCCQTASARTALGPIVAYRDRSEDEIRDIAVVRRTADGWTEPRLVHADGWKIGGCPVNGPSLIARDQQ